ARRPPRVRLPARRARPPRRHLLERADRHRRRRRPRPRLRLAPGVPARHPDAPRARLDPDLHDRALRHPHPPGPRPPHHLAPSPGPRPPRVLPGRPVAYERRVDHSARARTASATTTAGASFARKAATGIAPIHASACSTSRRPRALTFSHCAPTQPSTTAAR